MQVGLDRRPQPRTGELPPSARLTLSTHRALNGTPLIATDANHGSDRCHDRIGKRVFLREPPPCKLYCSACSDRDYFCESQAEFAATYLPNLIAAYIYMVHPSTCEAPFAGCGSGFMYHVHLQHTVKLPHFQRYVRDHPRGLDFLGTLIEACSDPCFRFLDVDVNSEQVRSFFCGEPYLGSAALMLIYPNVYPRATQSTRGSSSTPF